MDDEERSGYEGWLDDIAGRRVKLLPLVLAWLALTGAGCGVAYLLGARSDAPYNVVLGVLSFPYWVWAVPWYLRRQRDR